MEPTAFFNELFIAIQNRLAEKAQEIREVNMDLMQLEVYELTPSVAWPCFLIDFPDTSYADLLKSFQEGTAIIQGRLGFNPFSKTSNLQTEEIRRKGLQYFEIEQKAISALHGWQPLKESGEALCQPLYLRRATTEKREDDGFRVRVLQFDNGFHVDQGSDIGSIKPNLDLDMGFDEAED